MSKILFGRHVPLVREISKIPTALEMAERRLLACEARATRYAYLVQEIKDRGADTSCAEGLLKRFQEAAYLMGLFLVREQERLQ